MKLSNIMQNPFGLAAAGLGAFTWTQVALPVCDKLHVINGINDVFGNGDVGGYARATILTSIIAGPAFAFTYACMDENTRKTAIFVGKVAVVGLGVAASLKLGIKVATSDVMQTIHQQYGNSKVAEQFVKLGLALGLAAPTLASVACVSGYTTKAVRGVRSALTPKV